MKNYTFLLNLMTRKGREKPVGGFTLMEVLLAVTIFSIVAISLFSAFRSGVFGYRAIEEAIDLNQSVFSALSRLDTDVRNCFSFSVDDNKFTADSSNLGFLTLTNVFEGKGLEKKYAYVSYSIKDNKLTHICRVDSDALNVNSTVLAEEMVENAQIKFEYGYIQSGRTIIYTSGWTDKKSLPVCIKVVLTVGQTGKAAKVFERSIYLITKS